MKFGWSHRARGYWAAMHESWALYDSASDHIMAIATDFAAQRLVDEEIAAEIKRHHEHIKVLKIRRNSFCAVNQLPNDVLTHVFHFVKLRAEASSADGVFSPRAYSRWTVLLRVCHAWRELIINTPSFWSTINLNSSNAWGMLALSKCALLRIDVRHLRLGSNDLSTLIILDNLFTPLSSTLAIHYEGVPADTLKITEFSSFRSTISRIVSTAISVDSVAISFLGTFKLTVGLRYDLCDPPPQIPSFHCSFPLVPDAELQVFSQFCEVLPLGETPLLSLSGLTTSNVHSFIPSAPKIKTLILENCHPQVLRLLTETSKASIAPNPELGCIRFQRTYFPKMRCKNGISAILRNILFERKLQKIPIKIIYLHGCEIMDDQVKYLRGLVEVILANMSPRSNMSPRCLRDEDIAAASLYQLAYSHDADRRWELEGLEEKRGPSRPTGTSTTVRRATCRTLPSWIVASSRPTPPVLRAQSALAVLLLEGKRSKLADHGENIVLEYIVLMDPPITSPSRLFVPTPNRPQPLLPWRSSFITSVGNLVFAPPVGLRFFDL
ncbi:hypothetical protein ONZ45_g3074 [Pleurotus djamor]|nr:hypothetical protein ONZ45_g3074 [Pleurotus djamor]